MAKTEVGSRVGALMSMGEDEVQLLGYGVYDGDFRCEEFHNLLNPKITLDDGRVVWGYQCWWGPEEMIKRKIGDRKVVQV